MASELNIEAIRKALADYRKADAEKHLSLPVLREEVRALLDHHAEELCRLAEIGERSAAEVVAVTNTMISVANDSSAEEKDLRFELADKAHYLCAIFQRKTK